MNPADTPVLRDLDEIAALRRVKPKDCRDCRNYQPSDDGMAYGWCAAHQKFVKLYHPAGEWYSQCQIMSLRRVRPAG